jgi:tetratricopeptide (TPR) repeat protein
MTRDNIVFTICGFLLGLILGSLVIGPKFAQPAVSAPPPAPAQPAVPAQPEGAAAMGMVRQQLESAKQRLATNPNDVAALVQLGNLYQDATKYAQAVDYYERALRVREDPMVRTDLGICYKEAGDVPKALAAFQQVVREKPDQWQAMFNEVVLLAELHRGAEARAAAAKLQKLRPEDPEVAKLAAAVAGIK